MDQKIESYDQSKSKNLWNQGKKFQNFGLNLYQKDFGAIKRDLIKKFFSEKNCNLFFSKPLDHSLYWVYVKDELKTKWERNRFKILELICENAN